MSRWRKRWLVWPGKMALPCRCASPPEPIEAPLLARLTLTVKPVTMECHAPPEKHGWRGDRMNRLRMAVIGVGHLGKEHARILAGLADVELVGVADVSAEQAR